MKLSKPQIDGNVSLERSIKNRRTIRSYRPVHLTFPQFSQLLWAAQGITEERGLKRAAPSGGALNPIDIYSVVGKEGVDILEEGIYHYEPEHHTVSLMSGGDLRDQVAEAALGQMWMASAPINIMITAEYDRICKKYGERGVRYAIIEAGHIGQNIFLQAAALGLSTGIVGAFHDKTLIDTIKIPKSHQPLLIIPVGYKR